MQSASEKGPGQKAEVCHINTPLLAEERAAIEALARQENRSRGQQIRHLATLKLREMGLLPARPGLFSDQKGVEA